MCQRCQNAWIDDGQVGVVEVLREVEADHQSARPIAMAE